MIKVTQNSFRPDSKLKRLNNLNFSLLKTRSYDFEEKGFLNFATDDFLGINRKYQLISDKNVVTSTNYLTDYSYVINTLQKIFNRNITFFEDETIIHQEVLDRIIGPNDIIILDELVNPHLKLAVKQLQEHNVFIIKHNNLSKIEEISNSQHKTGNCIWYLAQSIYPVPGSALPVKEINDLLAKYSQLYCYVDESYGLSWTGTAGKGLIAGKINHPEKIVLIASLTKGFGAISGAIAISDIPALNSILPANENRGNLESLLFAADLHNSDEIVFLQSQLQENINYYHELIDGYLPCLSNPGLPVSFIAGGLPELCHEVCCEMLRKGFYVSAAIYPHASINQPGIKINISADLTKQNIKNMTEALKEAFRIVLKRRNKTLTEIL